MAGTVSGPGACTCNVAYHASPDQKATYEACPAAEDGTHAKPDLVAQRYEGRLVSVSTLPDAERI